MAQLGDADAVAKRLVEVQRPAVELRGLVIVALLPGDVAQLAVGDGRPQTVVDGLAEGQGFSVPLSRLLMVALRLGEVAERVIRGRHPGRVVA